jgi:hypothetical protein
MKCNELSKTILLYFLSLSSCGTMFFIYPLCFDYVKNYYTVNGEFASGVLYIKLGICIGVCK